MRSGTLFSRALPLLVLLTSLTTAVPLAAQEEGAENDTGLEQIDDQSFWSSWRQFITDIKESNLNHNPDPWEGWNRKVYAFNDRADRWVLKPLAKGYQWITPDPVESGISNVFSNLLELRTIVNDLLQWKLAQGAADTGRFLINSTIGLVGIFDVASPLGLEKHNEDFGQTLGSWGVGSGPYMVVPFFGSYTLRSGTGAVIGTQTTHYTHFIDHARTRNQIYIVDVVDRRASLLAAEKLITGDRYTFIRDAYLQQREFLVNDGVVEDTFGEEDYEDDWLEMEEE